MRKVALKKARKLYDGKCFFCEENRQEALEAHRIFHGSEGGKYTWENMLTLCATHHKLVHAGIIKVLRRHLCTSGKWLLHYIDETGVEHWKA